MPAPPQVLISEVGPRDELQSIEVASFVPAALLPQMADAAELVRHAASLPGWTVMALVPNLRGAAEALTAGAHKLTVPVSASEAHSLANVRKTREQMLNEVRRIVALRNEQAPQVGLEVGLSTAFGCTIQGLVPEDDVMRLAESLADAGVDDIGLSDTTGIDLKRLVAARGPLRVGLPGEPVYGMTHDAGLPKAGDRGHDHGW